MSVDARKVGQWVAVGAVVVGVVAGVVIVTRPADTTPQPAAAAPVTSAQTSARSPAADPTSPNLTLAIASSVWDESWQARERKSASAYTESTCASYINTETSQRKATDTADLLEAFEESKKYRPPWAIEDSVLVSVDFPGGELGRLSTEATVTDNRNVPPTQDRRVVEYDMTFESGRWKLCPSTTPLG